MVDLALERNTGGRQQDLGDPGLQLGFGGEGEPMAAEQRYKGCGVHLMMAHFITPESKIVRVGTGIGNRTRDGVLHKHALCH
jgi:hypothetical protein